MNKKFKIKIKQNGTIYILYTELLDILQGKINLSNSEIIEINEFIGILDINGKEIYNNSETVNGLTVKYNHLHACYGLYNANGYLNDIQCEMYNEDGTFIDIWKTNIELK